MSALRHRPSVRSVAAVAAVVLIGCGPALVAPVPPAAAAAPHTLHAGGSIEETWLTGAGPGDAVTLEHDGHAVPVSGNPGTADSLGSLIVRDLTPGPGYAWHDATSGQTTTTFAVLAPGADPRTDSALYTDQPMHQGLNYITMRDGIRLAATVRYPYGGTCSATAPCPTVIEYSGYATAAPTDPIPSLLAQATGTSCSDCGDKNLLPDSATDVGAVLARVSGFATVSLQMRGTGCSGGAFDLFGYPSDYDAYDAVEIVAHQDWVAHHKVGMVGISYSGLSELPSAGTDPPGLAAIAPMSPTDDLFSTGYPGGIYNDGFAAGWIADRIDDAKPAATLVDGRLAPLASTPVSNVGQPWVYYEIDAELAASGGASSTCLADQALHGQSESLSSLVGPQLVAPGTGPGRDPSLSTGARWTSGPPTITVPGVHLRRHCRTSRPGPSGRRCWRPSRDDAGLRQPWSTATTSTPPTPRPSAGGSSSSTSTWPTRCPPRRRRSRVWCSTTSPASRRARRPRHPCRPSGSRADSPTQARHEFATPDAPGRGPLRQRGRVRPGPAIPQSTYSASSTSGRPRDGSRRSGWGREAR